MTGLIVFKSHQKATASARKRLFILVLVFIMIAFGSYTCSKEHPMVPEPIATLIQTLESQNPNCDCQPYINQYLWKNQTVYVLGYKAPNCDWFPTYYDSTGQEFALQTGYSYLEFIQESVFIENAWTCK